MFKRIITYTLLLAFGLMIPLSAAAQENGLEGRINAIENQVLGTTLAGSILERIDRMEEAIYGESYTGSILQRVDVLYEHVMETTETSPSMLTKINTIEWMVTKQITSATIQGKISNLEKELGVSTEETSLDARLANLGKFTFIGGKINMVPAILAKDSLVRVKTVTPLNSKTTKAGDVIELAVDEDILIGSVLIIPQGSKAVGKVTKVAPAKSFGRDAKLEFTVESVNCINGTKINTLIGDKAKKETLSLAKATGASLAGLVILGPVGLIGGAFISGKNIEIPPGSQMYVQTQNDQDLFGVTVE